MCGIAGVFFKSDNMALHAKNKELVQNILQRQTHRGPDCQALIELSSNSHTLLLGHNRLAIIDLDHANQPFFDREKRYYLSYNGMLYNYQELKAKLIALGHQFTTASDTEVVLTAFIQWRLDAFQYFNGMFALVIYDAGAETLYLCRDRFGIKPLFYYQDNNHFYFASTYGELASAFNLQPNYQLIMTGIQSGCFDSHRAAIYQDINQVLPGEVLVIKNDFTKQQIPYYSLKNKVINLIEDPLTIDQAVEQIGYLLDDAIKLRLQADVPLGISLSGGVDSGLIASFARDYVPNVTAYSFGDPKQLYSEAKLVNQTASKLDLNLQFVFPTPQEMQAAFWQVLRFQEAPFPNLNIVAQYLVYQAAQAEGVKVMLGGQGADEIFMGYRKYFLFYLQHLWQQKKISELVHFFISSIPLWFTELSRLSNNIPDLRRHRLQKACEQANFFDRQMTDIYVTSLPALLRYEDRNAMACSIESRLPFMDYRLVELALALPEKLKLYKGYSKWPLRAIASQRLPATIAFARLKRGFDVDWGNWLIKGLGEMMRTKLKSQPQLFKQRQIDHVFSDLALQRNSRLLSEAITLCWLADQEHLN